MQESNNQLTTPQEILKQIVTQFGKQIFNRSESARLEGLLSDYFTDDRAKLRLFRSAISQNIAHELLQADTLDKAAKTIKINTLKTKFQSENFLEEAIAREIVVCFAYALGWNISAKRETEVKPLPAIKEDEWVGQRETKPVQKTQPKIEPVSKYSPNSQVQQTPIPQPVEKKKMSRWLHVSIAWVFLGIALLIPAIFVDDYIKLLWEDDLIWLSIIPLVMGIGGIIGSIIAYKKSNK